MPPIPSPRVRNYTTKTDCERDHSAKCGDLE
jgi:hypothetical protein